MRKYAPVSNSVRIGWLNAVNHVVGTELLTKKPIQSVVAPPTVEPVPEVPRLSGKYTVVFSDMWDEFQPDYNIFTLLLNEAGKSMIPPREVVGISEADCTDKPDLVIFGPFGNNWRRFTDVPKICFTGENTRPILEADLTEFDKR